MSFQITQRPRRNRRLKSTRDMLQESKLSAKDFVLPMFVTEGSGEKQAISSMPGYFRYSLDLLTEEVKKAYNVGIPAVALFPALGDDKKDSMATESFNPNGLFQNAIKSIKDCCPDITLFTDVAMDPYSSDGHDGIVKDGKILNDETLEVLAKMALSQAECGADYVAPSDMMDGRIGYIREALDENGFTDVGIMSYSAKYASSFYGPFRQALESAPKFGDKKTYQMDYSNSREAIFETELDVIEGADIVMVKPALSYLDIIQKVKNHIDIPVAVYNVSGEYAMIKASAERGWIDERAAVIEVLTSMKRAGADIIFTYHALDAVEWI